MGFLELFLIGVGLSMDAFAVSVCRGLAMPRMDWRHRLHHLRPLTGRGLDRAPFRQSI